MSLFDSILGILTSHSIISQFQSIIWFFDKVLKNISQEVFKKILHDCRPCPTAGLVAIHKSVCFIRYFSSVLCCRLRTVPAKKDRILLCQKRGSYKQFKKKNSGRKSEEVTSINLMINSICVFRNCPIRSVTRQISATQLILIQNLLWYWCCKICI